MSIRSVPLLTMLAVALMVAGPIHANAQLGETSAFLAHVSNQYRVTPNVTYHVASGHENKLDLYVPRDANGPTPVLMYIHGGGWVGGSKEANVLRLLPYLEMGWAVVNVGYRLGAVARAPAAVEDGLCALRWVIRNADEYNLDPSRIVTSGNSAGGHLALTTENVLAPKSSESRRSSTGTESPMSAICWMAPIRGVTRSSGWGA
jgi:acetyl esterase/lipase